MTRFSVPVLATVFLALPLCPSAAADNLQHGRQLAQACAGCHGADGNSANPKLYPNLAAQAPAYLELQLANFKSGERPNPAMQAVATSLSPSDMRDLGAYYGAQVAHPQRAADRVRENQGRRIFGQGGAGGAPACAACHGADGHGQGRFPRVASQPAAYALEQLRVYRAAPSFHNPLAMVMKSVAVKLNEDEMRSVAAYMATMP